MPGESDLHNPSRSRGKTKEDLLPNDTRLVPLEGDKKRMNKRISIFNKPLIALLFVSAAQSVHSTPSPYQLPHAPATKSVYLTLPPGAVEPEGWLRDWCEQVRDGFTARMEDVHPAFKQAWAADYRITGPDLYWGKSGWPYEGGGYWFEGFAGIAVQLKDERLISLANRRFDAVVTNMNERSILFYWWLDRANDEDVKAAEGRYMSESEWPMWAAGLLGRALVRQYAATGDARVLKALDTAYGGNRDWVKLGWAGSNPWPAFATHSWTGNPKIAAALTAFYDQLGDENKKSSWSRYRRMPVPADGNDHGVHFLESTTAWALGYLWTGKSEFLEACLAWQRQVERDCMQPHGVPVFDESYGPTGAGRKTETCDVAAFVWSKNMLLWISGDGALADQTEQAFFNAAPGVFGRDGLSHLYLQPANYLSGGGQRSYGRSHFPLCCTAALNRILPEYVGGMWLASQDGGLVAACYGPALVNAMVGDRVKVHIASKTAYPFTETIAMKVEPERPVEFPLSLRVPAWCAAPEIRVNGKAITLAPVRGFQRIQRNWKAGDQVTVHLPMRAVMVTGLDRNPKGPPAPFASVHYGPLLFVLPIAETQDGKGADPAARWQFALAGKRIKVERDAMPARWEWPLTAPLRLKVASKAFDWPGNDPGVLPGLVEEGVAREVTLVPYGCAKYRIALFPVTPKGWRAGGGIELAKWQPVRKLKLREGKGVTYASDLKWTRACAGSETVLLDQNYKRQPLSIGGQKIPKGIWTHSFQDGSPADTVFDIQGRNFLAFRALVGLDELGVSGSVQFQVWVDGNLKAETTVLRSGQSWMLHVDLTGGKEITLRVLNGGDGYCCDHAVWGLARFLQAGSTDVVQEWGKTMHK